MKFGFANLGQTVLWHTTQHLAINFRAVEVLNVVMAVLVHFYRQPTAQCIGNACANAVQTAGVGVVVAVEFATCVQLREHNFHTADLQRWVNVHGDATSVVGNGNGAVVVQHHVNFVGKAVGGFVHSVVYNFPQQVVKTLPACCADVHTGAQTNCIQTFQHLNVACLIRFLCHCFLQRAICRLQKAEKFCANALVFAKRSFAFCCKMCNEKNAKVT